MSRPALDASAEAEAPEVLPLETRRERHQQRAVPPARRPEAFPEARVVRRMLSAASVEEAVRVVSRFFHRQFGVPAAVWLRDAEAGSWTLVASSGLDSGARTRLRRRLGTADGWRELDAENQAELAARYRAVAGVRHHSVLETRDAFVLVGGASPAVHHSIRVLRPVMEDVLRHLGIVMWAIRRNRHLDLAMALTLHELRGPLVGARAAMGQLAVADGRGGGSLELVSRSKSELDHLLTLVDTLLPWTVGLAELELATVDLVDVVRQAVASCRLELGEDRVRLQEQGPAIAVVDAPQMRHAVANLVRNALRYSPPETEVRVRVECSRGGVTVAVHDRGPGIKPAERRAIFDPFARGEAGRVRRGNGLGLFMARRVVEAHGGELTVRSAKRGAVFTIRLPSPASTT